MEPLNTEPCDVTILTRMDGKFGKGVKTPVFNVECGAELEGWRKFIKRFEIAVIGAGLKYKDGEGVKSRRKAETAEYEQFEIEQRKAALLLDSMGDYGMEIFETWDIDVETLQYTPLKMAFEEHFSNRENIVATRHRFLCLEQRSEERLDKYIERVERSGNTCRWGGLEEDMKVLIIIKGMHVDKIRNELLLKKELTMHKVKQICNRYESALAAAKILTKTDPKPTSEVDAIEERGDREGISADNVADIDRVGASNYGRGGGFRGRGYGRGRGRGRGRGCWTCGEFNHDYRACRERAEKGKEEWRRTDGPPKCYVCSSTAHIAKNCPDKFKQKESGQGKINAVAGYSSDSDQESL